MINLKEIQCQLDAWEEEALEAVAKSGITGSSELDDAVTGHIQQNHMSEIDQLIEELAQAQTSIGTDHDELTPELDRESVESDLALVDELLDKLRVLSH